MVKILIFLLFPCFIISRSNLVKYNIDNIAENIPRDDEIENTKNIQGEPT